MDSLIYSKYLVADLLRVKCAPSVGQACLQSLRGASEIVVEGRGREFSNEVWENVHKSKDDPPMEHPPQVIAFLICAWIGGRCFCMLVWKKILSCGPRAVNLVLYRVPLNLSY